MIDNEGVDGLKITDIIIYPFAKPKKKKMEKNNWLATARIVFNSHFLVSGIRILKNIHGQPFLSFPKEVRQYEGETAWDICYPITVEFRTYISDTVIDMYEMKKEVMS